MITKLNNNNYLINNAQRIYRSFERFKFQLLRYLGCTTKDLIAFLNGDEESLTQEQQDKFEWVMIELFKNEEMNTGLNSDKDDVVISNSQAIKEGEEE